MADTSLVVEMATEWRPALMAVEAVLQRVRLNLDEMDRRTTARNARRITWGVDDLSFKSKIRVVLAPRVAPSQRSESSLLAVAAGVVSGVDVLHGSQQIPDFYSAGMVNRVHEISSNAARGGITQVALSTINGTSRLGVIDSRTAANAAAATRAAAAAFSSVTGVLDVVNFRQLTRPRAQVYNASTRRAVEVVAGRAATDRLRDALGRRVMVSGKLARNAAGQPIRIELDDLVALPDLEQAITADDLLGSDQGATGHRTVEEFLDWIRDRDVP